eukprot:XP_019073940.1 PREDICTED: G-type lectin S-receptor-like serine/threonine-protein kinase B120 isoform X1 [Vitis vinifera]
MTQFWLDFYARVERKMNHCGTWGCGMDASCRCPTAVILFLLSIFYSLPSFCYAANTLTQGQSIRDGETVNSSSQHFALGFFSPENSTSRYVGIWYNKIEGQTVVWVANRDSPISGTDGVLSLDKTGNLVVFDGNGSSIWSSNASASSSNSTAILLDTGNLVLSSSDNVGDTDKAFWQSFNSSTDTFLPGMKVLVDETMGENRVFTSWKTEVDPSPGNYTMGVDPRAAPQIVIWDGSIRWWRSGHWNGLIFTGIPDMMAVYSYGFKYTTDEDGKSYFTYTPSNSSDLLRFQVRWNGTEEQLRWDGDKKEWGVVQSQPDNECEEYNKCGAFGICSFENSASCSCLEGFHPRHVDQWNKGNWSGGCVRRTQLQCDRSTSANGTGEGDGFLTVEGVKLPDFADRVNLENKECEKQCLQNCSCMAYAHVTGIGCMMWGGDLVDIQHFAEGGRTTLHLRLAGSELGGKGIAKLVIVIIVVVGAVFLSLSTWLLWRFRAKLRAFLNLGQRKNELPILYVSGGREFSKDFSGSVDLVGEGKQGSGSELPLFNFKCVAAATGNFSDENKLGQGGFGPVYKGMLPGGEEIAVKRLSRRSGQGLEEFKNEMTLIAKLQHRNLVRLLGCCIEGEEKMLLYEYMPNKSLDFFIFDPAKQAELDWRKRFTIIEGIARGLLYLHRDSRLRIIHRDMKASNILLDEEMNPKISDFGMARIFGGDQNEANTTRVVGTYGYMSPEYAMEGLFSVKSDVYSFGVLLLEIVSGRRNTSFRLTEHSNLLSFAWQLWNEGKAMEFVDSSIRDSCSQDEVLRCIKVGMLCVQDSTIYRPTMSTVVLMLESETATLPMPRQPTFTSTRSSIDLDLFSEGLEIVSSNNITLSAVVGR